MAKALKESNKNCEQDVCAIRSILLGAEIIKCTERKDGRFVSIFVSIKNKDSFEKLLNSLNSKTLKSIIIEKEKSEKEDGLKDITMRIVHLLKKNRSICENSKGIVTSTSVAKALRMNPSKGLYHKVMLVLNVLADTPSDFGIRSNSSVVRSCARDFVNEFNNGKRVKWENLSKDLKGHDERSVCDVKNILIGAGIIEYTEKKDGRFVSIKNKDKFEKLRNSLNSKILKKYSHKEKEKCT